jgi:hypothetical protein
LPAACGQVQVDTLTGLGRARGQVVFELPHPRTDGATHLLRDPLELIEKLTLLIPPRVFTCCAFTGARATRGVAIGGDSGAPRG